MYWVFAWQNETSRKRYNEFGEWEHDEIILEPKNKDYTPIVIDEAEADDFRVIGEFIGVIKEVWLKGKIYQSKFCYYNDVKNSDFLTGII